jgi:hypothetical protein
MPPEQLLFFNASIRYPIIAFVATIPFVIYAIARSLQKARASQIVLAWVSAATWAFYGFWEEYVYWVHHDWNIRVDLFPVFAALYAVTLSCLWALLFSSGPITRSAE